MFICFNFFIAYSLSTIRCHDRRVLCWQLCTGIHKTVDNLEVEKAGRVTNKRLARSFAFANIIK